MNPEKDYKDAIITELSKIANIEKSLNERGKVMAYLRAISNIKGYHKPITSVK